MALALTSAGDKAWIKSCVCNLKTNKIIQEEGGFWFYGSA